MQTMTLSPAVETGRRSLLARLNWPRGIVVALTAIAIFLPLSLVFYQSFLSAPFFMPMKEFGLDSFRFIFDDPDFKEAFVNGFLLATGLMVIAVPLGAMLAFLMVRTDLPGRRWIGPLLLVPIFVSPMVMGFGYVVSMGPVGFYTLWVKDLIGVQPWNVYAFPSIVVIAGLTHVPHVYLYASSALKSLGSDVEEAARVTGASPLQVALNVSLPMVMPALAYAAVLVFFLGFEVFGLVLVLGDPEGHLVLATYLYKLTNKLGTPSYHLMAAVAVCLVAVTLPPSRMFAVRPGLETAAAYTWLAVVAPFRNRPDEPLAPTPSLPEGTWKVIRSRSSEAVCAKVTL